jgi:transposase
LGVDDWALRKGQRYGTILVDLQRHAVVDLLPDRSSESLETWLKAHPGVEILSRDRAEVYAEGARLGAPCAQQVADRWHLLKNLGEALERVLVRHHRHIRQAVEDMAASEQASDRSQEAVSEPAPLSATQSEQQQRRQKRDARYQQVHELKRQGFTLSQIHRQTQMSYRTLHKYLNSESCPYYPANRRGTGSHLTPFVPYLRERWEQGCHNARQLLQEIHAQGYAGHYSRFAECVSSWRPRLPGEGSPSAKGTSAPRHIKHDIPCPSAVRWWIQGHLSRSDLDKQVWQRSFLNALYERCPELAQAARLSEEFVRMVKQRLVSDLDAWVARVQQSALPELKSFALGLLQDRSSVESALSSEWSNGQTEGQVNRLKMIKRQMYGRANFDLLRRRVLQPT